MLCSLAYKFREGPLSGSFEHFTPYASLEYKAKLQATFGPKIELKFHAPPRVRIPIKKEEARRVIKGKGRRRWRVDEYAHSIFT